ncbi:mucin-1-like [Ixodes scapularis]|uniref:mucin-1-like n=1 Tax=Ixodes scapularis TaxID=6945 RepID=UPI001C388EC8|nr:mucin-1-like [Ixodes scapularis]
MTPASPAQPTKACTFDVSCPPGASVDSIFDAAVAIVGTAELFSVQHLGGSNFQMSVTSSSAMSRIVNAGALTIGGRSVPIVPVGPQVTSITCLYLPIYVRNEALAAALSLYGKVLDIRFGVYQDHPNLRTGTRYIRMEMKESTPVPNFLRVSGHRATFDYRGLKRVCRRCQQEGHLKAACNVPYCARCAAFGHDTVGCAAGCGRCGAAHATVDCTQRRSYSAVAGCGQDDFPALTPASQTPKSQGRPPTTPTPPPAATAATQGSGDTPAPAEPPVTTPSELAPTSQQSKPASATDANSNASQDAAEAALSNAVHTASVHAPTPTSPGSEEVLVKEERPRTPELCPSPLPSWSDITEDSASSTDDRLVIDEVAHDKDSALPRGRDRRRGTSEELRKTCSRSRSPHGGAEDGKRDLSSSGESGSPGSTPASAAAPKRLRKDLVALSDSSCITSDTSTD